MFETHLRLKFFILKKRSFSEGNFLQKNLKKDYSTDPYNHVVLKNAYRSNFSVAGGKTPAAKTSNDLPMGTKSPMTNVKRPPKPATGAQPRG